MERGHLPTISGCELSVLLVRAEVRYSLAMTFPVPWVPWSNPPRPPTAAVGMRGFSAPSALNLEPSLLAALRL